MAVRVTYVSQKNLYNNRKNPHGGEGNLYFTEKLIQ